MSGKFIVFEGMPGSGKTTQIKKLVEYLKDRKIEAIAVPAFGLTPFGKALNELWINDEIMRCVDPFTQCLMLATARSESLQRSILPALNDGIWVILDRYVVSTFVHQGILGANEDDIIAIEDFVCGELPPTFTFYLDVSFEESKKRCASRIKEGGKRFNIVNEEYFNEIRQRYLDCMTGIEVYRCRLLNTNDKNEDEVAACIQEVVESRTIFNLN